MKLLDFKIGDIIVITTVMRAGTARRCAQVTDLDYNGLGLVQHGPTSYGDLLDSGYGSWDPTQVGAKRYGKQHVEVVGHRKIRGPGAHVSPRPGNTAYDLMC